MNEGNKREGNKREGKRREKRETMWTIQTDLDQTTSAIS